MESDIAKKFAEQEERLEKIYVSVEKTRKYFLWTLITQGLFFLLPLLALIFAIPFFLNILSQSLGI